MASVRLFHFCAGVYSLLISLHQDPIRIRSCPTSVRHRDDRLYPAFAIAILRYHLFDIDIVIRLTLVYASVTGLLGLVFAGGIVLLQFVFRKLTGQASDLAVVVTTLAIAALFNPLRLRIQALIDRRYYRAKYNADQALAELTNAARSGSDLDELSSMLIELVLKTLQPAQVSLQLKAGERSKLCRAKITRRRDAPAVSGFEGGGVVSNPAAPKEENFTSSIDRHRHSGTLFFELKSTRIERGSLMTTIDRLCRWAHRRGVRLGGRPGFEAVPRLVPRRLGRLRSAHWPPGK